MSATAQDPRTPEGVLPAAPGHAETCAHCHAALAADQRYCLNCGLRRGGERVPYRELLAGESTPPDPAPAIPAPASPPAASARAVSPLGAAVILGLLLLSVLLGAVIGASRGGGDPVVVGGSAAPAQAAAAPATFTSDWTGGGGWTIQIQAFEKAGTTPEQVARAKSDAAAKGVPAVGALDSDAFASLDPGRYVIFSGRFDSRKRAQAALDAVTRSYPEAVVVEVSETAPRDDTEGSRSGSDSGGGSEGKAPATGVEAVPADPDEASKKSRKLPDQVGTGGAPPPEDDKAPAGGGELETIG
jgi:hypothetical protein